MRVAQDDLSAAQCIRRGYAFAFKARDFCLRRIARRQRRRCDTFGRGQVRLRRGQPFLRGHKCRLRLLKCCLGRAKVTCVLQGNKRGAGIRQRRLCVGHRLIGCGTDRGHGCDIGNCRIIGLLRRSHSRLQSRPLQRNGGINVGCRSLRLTHGTVGRADFVGDGQHRLTGHAVVRQDGGDGGRVRKRLIGDQVRDDPRIGVIDRAAGLQVGGRTCLRRARIRIGEMRLGGLGQEGRIQIARHDLVGRAPGFTAFRQVVHGPVDKSQAVGKQGVQNQVSQRRSRRVLFGNQNLVKNVLEVVGVDVNHCRSPGSMRGRPWRTGEMPVSLP